MENDKQRGGKVMEHIQNHTTCADCGAPIDARSYILECDYCLSKKED